MKHFWWSLVISYSLFLAYQRSWKIIHLTWWFLVIYHYRLWFPNSGWERYLSQLEFGNHDWSWLITKNHHVKWDIFHDLSQRAGYHITVPIVRLVKKHCEIVIRSLTWLIMTIHHLIGPIKRGIFRQPTLPIFLTRHPILGPKIARHPTLQNQPDTLIIKCMHCAIPWAV